MFTKLLMTRVIGTMQEKLIVKMLTVGNNSSAHSCSNRKKMKGMYKRLSVDKLVNLEEVGNL